MKILIIGGSNDLGISLAKYLEEKGHKVIVGYNTNPVTEVESVKCDVRNKTEIERTIAKLIAKYQNIDVLINMAAISRDNLLENISKEDFMDTLEVNLVGSFLTSQIYSKYIKDGMIINIASTDGIDTYNEYNLCYAASKSALITMSKNLATCTSNKVICVCPNWCDSASTRSFDENFLYKELVRIGQRKLITTDEVSKSVYKIITNNFKILLIIIVDFCITKIQ